MTWLGNKQQSCGASLRERWSADALVDFSSAQFKRREVMMTCAPTVNILMATTEKYSEGSMVAEWCCHGGDHGDSDHPDS